MLNDRAALVISEYFIKAKMKAPMASVIIFGLLSSTALNMLVVPAVYYALHTRRATTSGP